MKQDVDRLLQTRGLDALWVTGAAKHNPSMVYFTGVANITRADLIKKRGEPPVLFHYPMERDEAARTGLDCRNIAAYKPRDLLRQAGGSLTRANAFRMARIFRDLSVKGKVAVAGVVDLASVYPVLEEIRKLESAVDLAMDGDDPVLVRARALKSPEEIERIRLVGRICTQVMDETADRISSHWERAGVLQNRSGKPLLIGDIRSFVRRRITELGAELPEGMIFAQGRDAGIPHSAGSDDNPVVAGRPIVFDLFPCEAGGGYFYDITRTWSPGFATEEVERLHRQVRAAHDEAVAKARRGTACREVQQHVCRLFTADGHPTLAEDPSTESGYVHNLGHGVGLAVHESPSFEQTETNRDTLETGAVFTIEPGLYYPEKKIGVRIEDTLCINADGSAEILAPYDTGLVIPIQGTRPAKASSRTRSTKTGKTKR